MLLVAATILVIVNMSHVQFLITAYRTLLDCAISAKENVMFKFRNTKFMRSRGTSGGKKFQENGWEKRGDNKFLTVLWRDGP